MEFGGKDYLFCFPRPTVLKSVLPKPAARDQHHLGTVRNADSQAPPQSN